jgi:hypothetical protein
MGDGHGAGNGARLRLARQARGFSQQQLATVAGVSRQCGEHIALPPAKASRPWSPPVRPPRRSSSSGRY